MRISGDNGKKEKRKKKKKKPVKKGIGCIRASKKEKGSKEFKGREKVSRRGSKGGKCI